MASSWAGRVIRHCRTGATFRIVDVGVCYETNVPTVMYTPIHKAPIIESKSVGNNWTLPLSSVTTVRPEDAVFVVTDTGPELEFGPFMIFRECGRFNYGMLTGCGGAIFNCDRCKKDIS